MTQDSIASSAHRRIDLLWTRVESLEKRVGVGADESPPLSAAVVHAEKHAEDAHRRCDHLRSEVRAKHAEVLDLLRRETSETRDRLTADIARLSAEQAQAAVNALEATVDARGGPEGSRLDAGDHNLHRKCDAALDAAQARIAKLDAAVAAALAQRDAAEDACTLHAASVETRKVLTQELAGARARIAELEAAAHHDQEVAAALAQRDAARAASEHLTRERNAADAAARRHQQRIAELEAACCQREEALDTAMQQRDAAQADLDDAQRDARKLEAALLEERNEHARAVAELREANAELIARGKQRNDAHNALAKERNEHSQTKRCEQHLRERHASLRRRADYAERALQRMREACALEWQVLTFSADGQVRQLVAVCPSRETAARVALAFGTIEPAILNATVPKHRDLLTGEAQAPDLGACLDCDGLGRPSDYNELCSTCGGTGRKQEEP